MSKNYRGDVNLLAERCNDDFKDVVNCTVCTPKLDQEFADALKEQRTPKAQRQDASYWRWVDRYQEYEENCV